MSTSMKKWLLDCLAQLAKNYIIPNSVAYVLDGTF